MSEQEQDELAEVAITRMRLRVLKENPDAGLEDLNKKMRELATEEISAMWGLFENEHH